MNIISAWEKARPGEKIKRKMCLWHIVKRDGTDHEFIKAMGADHPEDYLMLDVHILARDWVVVRK